MSASVGMAVIAHEKYFNITVSFNINNVIANM